ncbi:MAG: LysM domain-containing protein [Sedimentibacter sp.]|uniref:LysM peptidoglycan-binding domain-containing protein n=1 Tax=Sedimentibacter sp. TaxID=1960295 RepID=UPI002982070B|nr:LysM domain-containing protein [Sedimentibacter sp.]MDW5299328.1 LysM domain-containing protein [Sedimentibacter sp.]
MKRYIVKPYDTLLSIAHRFGVTYAQLLAANPRVLQSNHITVGQIMAIPCEPLPIAPVQLEVIMSNAEGIIEDINNQDWDNAGDKVSLIISNFAELEPMIQSIPPNLIYNLNSAIINLAKEVASQNKYESKVQANIITLYISYMLDYFNMEIPPCIYRLKYSGRKIILNVENNNWSSADDDFDFVNVVWKNFQKMLPIGNDMNIIEFNQIVNSLGQSIKNRDAAETIKMANDMIGKIVALEEIFREN